MALAQGGRHELSYVAESTYGVTPTSPSPSMLRFRTTGSTLNPRKDNFRSEELRADRMVADLRHGLKAPTGDLNFELSYGAFDDWLEAALFGDWTGDVLKAGIAEHFFTVERRFTDIDVYERFTGVMVNTMRLNIVPNGMITGTFGVLASDVTTATSELGDPSDVATNSPLDGFTGSVAEGGATPGTGELTSLTLELTNNLQPANKIGSDKAALQLAGRSILTGTGVFFFSDKLLIDKFLNETETSLSVVLTGEGGSLQLDIGTMKYTGADADVTNVDDGVFISMPLHATLDSDDATSFMITRTAA